MAEFNLSEKLVNKLKKGTGGYAGKGLRADYAEAKDIKEFIKKEFELINKLILGRMREEDFWRERGKLAGSKLS